MEYVYDVKNDIAKELEGAGVSNPYWVADLIEKIVDIKLATPAKDEVDKIGVIINLLQNEDGAVRHRIIEYVDSWLKSNPYVEKPSRDRDNANG